MGELSRRALLGAVGAAGGLTVTGVVDRDTLVGGGGIAYDDTVFEIPSGERYGTDDGHYEAIRWQADSGLALAHGSKLTLEVA